MDILPAHARSLPELVEALRTNVDTGLGHDEVTSRLQHYGENRLTEKERTRVWVRFASQFYSLIIGLLVVSALVAGLLGEWIDTFVILAIVLLNGILGFLQEDRAERALNALRKLTAPMAKVRRDGRSQVVQASQLVPGDVIELEAGDHVPADARLASTFGLQVMESSLTGESGAVTKNHDVASPVGTPLGDRHNMVFASTVAVAGKATAIVAATGMSTEIGSIAGLLQQTRSEPTPLQRRLTELGRIMVGGCLAIVSVIFALQWWRGGNFVEVFLTSVSLAVAAIPEGLPAVVTITLAIGLSRMAKKNAIIRKLPSVETLGCVSVICSDKTGTLTSNEMTVTEVRIAHAQYRVSGNGYAAQGKIVLEHSGSKVMLDQHPTIDLQQRLALSDSDVAWMLRVGAMCNNAKWRWDDSTQRADFQGDPTEVALIVAASKTRHASAAVQVEFLHENPFDSDRKMMSQVYRFPDETRVLVAKGAPEVIASRATSIRDYGHDRELSEHDRRQIANDNSEMAGKALRVLALAYRILDDTHDAWTNEENLTFLGLVGMMDPPRPEVRVAVARCVSAGIIPVMITGDHPATAHAVARNLQIADAASRIVTGPELQSMNDEQLFEQVEQCAVFARVSAHDKLRIVNAWRTKGHVVAMTGDGVNDAPAVKAADIGIVMGITGTDVAKESSDMILADDNFATIVNAVEEGRGIYENIQKFLHYLLACNAGEVLFMFVSTLIGWPSPLVPIQILWINLVTDGFPALSLAVEPIEKHLMLRPPRSPTAAFLSWSRISLIAFHGSLIACVALLAFSFYLQPSDTALAKARTVAFCTMALSQIFFSMGCRSFSKTMPQIGPLSNPMILCAMIGSVILQVVVVSFPLTARLLDAVPLDALDWLIVAFLALLPVTVVEVLKLVILRPDKNPR